MYTMTSKNKFNYRTDYELIGLYSDYACLDYSRTVNDILSTFRFFILYIL